MTWIAVLTGLTLSVTTGAATAESYEFRSIKKMEQNCRIIWDNADVDKSLTLTGDEAVPYFDAMRASHFEFEAARTGAIALTEFNNACTLGVFIPAIRRKCDAIWVAADTDGNGQLGGAEAAPFMAPVSSNGVRFDADKNGTIDDGEYNEVCKLGVFVAAETGPADAASPASAPAP